jgi:hypothetical protein
MRKRSSITSSVTHTRLHQHLAFESESDRHATSIMFDASVLVSVELALKAASQRTDEEAKSIKII